MKRNKNLKTLSWEHHDGLVVSFRLQQGLKKKANVNDMSDYIFHIWDKLLEHHFWQEEQTLSNLKISSEFTSQMKNEHKQIRNLIGELNKDSKNKNFIEEFAEFLNKHIRFEERQLFPLIEKEVDSNQLDEIGKFLKDQHITSCKVWNNQFWKSSLSEEEIED